MDNIDKQYIILKLTNILQTLRQDIQYNQTKYQQEIARLNRVIDNKDQIIEQLTNKINKLQLQNNKKDQGDSGKLSKKIVLSVKNKNATSSFNLNMTKKLSKTKISCKQSQKQNKICQENITNRGEKNRKITPSVPLHENVNIDNNYHQNINSQFYSITSPKSPSIPRPFSSQAISKMLKSVPTSQKSEGLNYPSKMIKSTTITPFNKTIKSKVKTQRSISTVTIQKKSSKSKSKSKCRVQNVESLHQKQKRCINLIIPA